MEAETFDYIVIGGGSAGAVLASRLSEDPGVSVLLLEAGGSGRSFMQDMPAGSYKIIGDRRFDWMYLSEPDPTSAGRVRCFNSGRMLGGGSGLNGMVYIRGSRADYDRWAGWGCAGWAFADVLPYFLRSETFTGAPRQNHGLAGPQRVSEGRVVHDLAAPWLAGAAAELGLPVLDDYCGGDQEGAFLTLGTTARGERWSTARGFLQPARRRPNLEVRTGCLVDRVGFSDGVASRAYYQGDGARHIVRAGREIVLCAGAIGTPAILLRSGVGPPADLQAMGIAVNAASGEVGRNLHDHPAVLTSRLVDRPTYNVGTGPVGLMAAGLSYLAFRRGRLTTTVVQAMAMAKTRPELDRPDVALSFVPLAMDRSGGLPKLHKRAGITASAWICQPWGRGSLRLRSSEPQAPPIIDYPILADERDLQTLIAACKLNERIFSSTAFGAHVVGRNLPDRQLQSDDEWEAYVRQNVNICFHTAGACRMGADNQAVVDPTLRVRGVGALRVADASIMPELPSANINAAAIMIGEKAADMIKAERRA